MGSGNTSNMNKRGSKYGDKAEMNFLNSAEAVAKNHKQSAIDGTTNVGGKNISCNNSEDAAACVTTNHTQPATSGSS